MARFPSLCAPWPRAWISGHPPAPSQRQLRLGWRMAGGHAGLVAVPNGLRSCALHVPDVAHVAPTLGAKNHALG